MKQLISISIVALLTGFAMAGCSSSAHVEKDNSANFTNYKTYAWSVMKNQDGQKGNMNSLEEQQVKDAVNKELKKQGWSEVDKKPDVLINYDVLVERSTDTRSDPVYSRPAYRTFYNPYRRRFYTVYYPSRFLGYDNYEVPVKEGTVTITITDNKTDKVVWQGWSTNEIDSRHFTRREIEGSVKAIFKKFDVASN